MDVHQVHPWVGSKCKICDVYVRNLLIYWLHIY